MSYLLTISKPHGLALLILVMLSGCATNDHPAEIVTATELSPQIKNTKVIQANLQPTRSVFYVVKVGDTIESVASQFGLAVDQLIQLNELVVDAPLFEGQRLLIKTPINNMASNNFEVDQNNDGSEPENVTIDSSSLSNDFDTDATQTLANKSVQNGETADYVSPVSGQIIKAFGTQADGSINKGINIAAPKGVPVVSISDGVVKYAGSKAEGYGKIVVIKNANGTIATYAHLNTIKVKVGAVVSAGEIIGTVGATGNVHQPQLQLQIRGADKDPINPSSLIANLGN